MKLNYIYRKFIKIIKHLRRSRAPIQWRRSIRCRPLAFVENAAPEPQRENFPGATKVNTGPLHLIGPLKRYRGHRRSQDF